VEINLTDTEHDTQAPAWNLFALEHKTAAEAAGKVEAFVDALAAAMRWDERNTRALNLATQAAQALVELALALPPELAPTIFQVPTLLSDDEWRSAILPDRATVPTDTLAGKLARYADLYRYAPAGRGQASAKPTWQARYPVFPDIHLRRRGPAPSCAPAPRSDSPRASRAPTILCSATCLAGRSMTPRCDDAIAAPRPQPASVRCASTIYRIRLVRC
jgi:hypothetical protein